MASFVPPNAGIPFPGANTPFPRPGFPTGIPTGIPPVGFRPPGVFGDADPITPGTQTTPGIVTATGPTRVTPGGFPGQPGFPGQVVGGLPGQVGLPSIPRPGFGIGAVGGVVDADPITPGIQSTPGVVTPVGPPRVVPGGAVGGPIGGVGIGGFPGGRPPFVPGTQFGGVVPGGIPLGGASLPIGGTGIGSISNTIVSGGVVDADPITPGIQLQPGTITPTGPPTIVSGPGVGLGGINTTLTSNIIGGGMGGIVDVDPITPGIQIQPGTLTPTGPTTVLTSGLRRSGIVGGGMLSSGVIAGPPLGFQTTFSQPPILTSGIQNFGGAVVDADPITPGIQLQPGTITPTGPPTVVSAGGGFGTSIGNFPVGLVDMDPITPGIQTQAGTVTLTGPTTVVGGGVGGYGYGGAVGGVVDADPLTPGIQTQPGVIRQTGPSYVVGNQGAFGVGTGICPWWVWPLLGLLLLGAIIGVVYAYFRSRGQQDS